MAAQAKNTLLLAFSWVLNGIAIIDQTTISFVLGTIATGVVIANGLVTLFKNIKSKK